MAGMNTDITGATYVETYAQMTVTAAAQTFAQLGVTVPLWALFAYVTPEAVAIRYRCDGTAPTATVGQPIAAGQSWTIQGVGALSAAQFICGASAVVSIVFRG